MKKEDLENAVSFITMILLFGILFIATPLFLIDKDVEKDEWVKDYTYRIEYIENVSIVGVTESSCSLFRCANYTVTYYRYYTTENEVIKINHIKINRVDNIYISDETRIEWICSDYNLTKNHCNYWNGKTTINLYTKEI